MNEIEVSFETLRKFLKGLQGDKRLKNWSVDWITERIQVEERKLKIDKLAEEWLNQFVRNHEWDRPELQELWGNLAKDYNNDKTDMIQDQVGYLMESVDLVWSEDSRTVIWNPYNHNGPSFDREMLPELLFYVNEQLRTK
jgi:hypothetical protein